LHAVQTGCSAHDEIDPLSVVERLPSLVQMHVALSKTVAEGRQDWWAVANMDGVVAGYGRVVTWREADGTQVYLCLGWVLPAWRGRGIGTQLLQWAEERSRCLFAEQPHERGELAANASSAESEAAALLLDAGYRPAYTVVEMELDQSQLPAPSSMPVGFVVVPVTPEHLTLIATSVREAYHDEYPGGRFNDEIEVEAYAASLNGPQHDPSLWQVAWAGDQVAGQVLAVVNHERAEVFEVSVRPAWRRHGLARALLLRALDELRRRNVSVIRLSTVAEFPTRAVHLYHSAGFRVIKTFPRYRKPMV
jgi:mycothiol synthase